MIYKKTAKWKKTPSKVIFQFNPFLTIFPRNDDRFEKVRGRTIPVQTIASGTKWIEVRVFKHGQRAEEWLDRFARELQEAGWETVRNFEKSRH